VGALYIGVAGYSSVNPAGADGIIASGGKNWRLLGVQVLASIVCGLWAAFWSFVILSCIDKWLWKVRVSDEHEDLGLDEAVFNERSSLRMSIAVPIVQADPYMPPEDPEEGPESAVAQTSFVSMNP